MSLAVREHVPLAPLTTFELGGAARRFVEVADESALVEALAGARARGDEVLVLGGGSNLVVADAGFTGTVVRLALLGSSSSERDRRVHLAVAAGEPWEPFVARCVEARLAGVECLSGIPGLVGATPIQNVGAYGQEVADTIVSVRTVHRRTGVIAERTAAECRFAYRHSAFKDEAARDEIVTRVTFALTPDGAPTVRYPELGRALHDRDAAGTLAGVRDVVLALRRGKSMVIDPSDPNRRSAGSFFTNPIVDRPDADAVEARAVGLGPMPRFAAGDRVKLSAGWLIERAGFAKGTRRGAVGISSNHALALVHHGGGTSAALLDLALEIVDGVRARFGVRLRPEPVLVGFAADHPLLRADEHGSPQGSVTDLDEEATPWRG
ncbi:MAG: UDP-N-acetylmuramate dehydrogenase [Polyangiales bacterium]